MDKYANCYGYSEIYPFEIVREVTDKTIEIRALVPSPDPAWTPHFIAGGFAGHCTNQNRQTWLYSSDPTAPVIRMRKRKDGKWYSKMGMHRVEDKPLYFYDYNF
jgi:hypothetical protein